MAVVVEKEKRWQQKRSPPRCHLVLFFPRPEQPNYIITVSTAKKVKMRSLEAHDGGMILFEGRDGLT
jgi:hypothetical protein